MHLRQDEHGASPLVVITTFVLGAIVLTAVAYAVFFDRPDEALNLVERRGDGNLTFEVRSSAGGLAWSELRVRFLDRAGADQAEHFLQLPAGDVGRGQRIVVDPLPGAGAYVLVVSHEGRELERLTVQL